jgi:cytochrome b561
MLKDTIFIHTKLTRIIHAVSAMLLVGLFTIGTIMVDLQDENQKTILYRAHTFIGILLVILTLIRIYNRIKNDHPTPEGIDGINKILYSVTHWMIYITLLTIGMSGGATMFLNQMNFFTIEPALLNRELISINIHQLVTKLILILVFIHLVGVIRYQFTKGNILARLALNIPLGKNK